MKRYLVFTNKYRSVFRCFLGLDTCSLLKLILVMKNSDSVLSTVLTCVTAPFNNMRTLKFKTQPTNGFFAAVNQVLSGSS